MKELYLLFRDLARKGAFYILTGSFLTKVVAFFGSIFVVRVLNKNDYGILGYIENFYSYVFLFAGFGLSNSILRYIVLSNNIADKYAYFKYAVKKGFIINIILTLTVIVINTIYPHPETFQPFSYLITILLVALPFHYLTDNVLCNERAMFSNKSFACLSFLISSSIIFGKIFLGRLYGLKGIILCQIFLYITLSIAFLLYTKNKHFFKKTEKVEIPKEKRKEVDIYSFQYMITNGLWTLFMLNDTFLLGRFCSEATMIADYKVAYVLPGNVSIISVAIGTFIAPYFIKHENDKIWIKKNFIKTYLLSALMVGILCIGLGLLARPLIIFMYGKQYENVVGLMRLLLISSFINCGLRYTTANILAAMGKIKYNMYISFIGMLLQIIINIRVIPLYGTLGVAYTSVFVYLFMAVALFIIFRNKYLKTV